MYEDCTKAVALGLILPFVAWQRPGAIGARCIKCVAHDRNDNRCTPEHSRAQAHATRTVPRATLTHHFDGGLFVMLRIE